MSKFTILTSAAAVLLADDIDTDQIIPARFLKVTTKDGLASGLFAAWRQDPGFVLNDPAMAGRQILVAGDNFGCGSSREHAPWALMAGGFRAVVAQSFADIFQGNALKNGLLPVALSAQAHAALVARLAQAPETELTVDLEAQTLAGPELGPWPFPVDGFARHCLLRGIDQLGYLRSFEAQVQAFEVSHGR
jgi:3-isopropylmalate/(R)-2-methylmalate dehydratase small subunit